MADIRIEEIRSLLPQAMLRDWVRVGSRLVRLLRDAHHPARHEAVLNRLLEEARGSVEQRARREALRPRVSYPAELPISLRADDIVQAIRAHQVVIIAGETGSGKTTQLPKMCLEAGLGIEAMIGCTQPRRVAALSISRRIAEELGVPWGQEVGCKIRFDDRSSPDTLIKLMTDGILLAETQGDPLLSSYNAIIIDEAHERSLNIDFLLGHLKGLITKRPELKLMITSATINTAAFSEAFNHAPIIEVSGRVYPVDVHYAPLDHAAEDAGDTSYIEAAARAAEQAAMEPGDGDVLIFMPTERDIRETCDAIRTRLRDFVELVPLYGRLSSGEQQRVFEPAARRKVVVATNIAETSLTIPNIRFVIDAGLARISRYNPRTRTRRLPIEPVSQSSANQRKGRAGRLRHGTCIRLYSEAEFVEMAEFTQPEIQRANLAEVILRMKAFRLGDIETFPFLNPPSPAAIEGGYKLLQELGALDATRGLTTLGGDLARLPIDPTLGRMLMQAQEEHAARELLIIASGLSIQDPRERPHDQQAAADAAHRRFLHPESDFLSLLNLWNGVHEQWEKQPTQNQRRKFCRQNFLSYVRMREWQDLHAQLHDALEDLGSLRINESNADYGAIHRSILAGLLAHVAVRQERNLYRGVGNRQLVLFPGSVLHSKKEAAPKSRHPRQPAPAPESSSQPEWLVAGEIVETSRLFARTVAGIDPVWVTTLAPHLCEVTYHNPRWSADAGKVIADEKTLFYGMEVRLRQVAYGNVNAREAAGIFVQAALVDEALLPEPKPGPRDRDPRGKPTTRDLLDLVDSPNRALPVRYSFVEHNRTVRQKIETWRTRSRRHDLIDTHEALARFYLARLPEVSSLDELNRYLRENPPETLFATEQDLAGDTDLSFDASAFPDKVQVGEQEIAVTYAYAPGEEKDGVTLRLNPALAEHVSSGAVAWAVPGLRESLANEMLRALPKGLRKELMPLPPKAREIAEQFQPESGSLEEGLARFIFRRYGVKVPPEAWGGDALPAHLRARVELVGGDKRVLAAGRDLDALRKTLAAAPVKAKPAEDPAWNQAVQRWEQFGVTSWSFGDLPERITLREQPEASYAWPGLQLEEQRIHLRLFRAPAAARQSTLPALRRLVELAIQKDLAWLERDLRGLRSLEPLCAGFCSIEDLRAAALRHLLNALLPGQVFSPLTAVSFQTAVASARGRVPGLAMELIDRLSQILQARREVLRRIPPVPASVGKPRVLSDLRHLGTPTPAAPTARPSSPIGQELGRLLPPDFLDRTRYEQLAQIPRYLKALQIRAERAAHNPIKDQEKARLLAPYQAALDELSGKAGADPEKREPVQGFRVMVEEYKISLFAQEMGTAFPISPKRLDEALASARAIVGS